jgi:putative copper resistance protein D
MHHRLYLLSVLVHILAAVLWIGGQLFLVLVVVPVTRRLPSRALAVQLIRDTGRRFRAVGWICLLTLLVTGVTNLLLRGIGPGLWSSPEFWAGPFGQTLAWKLALVGAIWALSAVHDFRVGPRASALLAADPAAPAALRLRRMASWMGRLNLLLSLLVLTLALMLVRGRPW